MNGFHIFTTTNVVKRMLLESDSEYVCTAWKHMVDAESNGPYVFELTPSNLEDETEELSAWEIVMRYGGIDLQQFYCTNDIHGEAKSSNELLDLIDIDALAKWIAERGLYVICGDVV